MRSIGLALALSLVSGCCWTLDGFCAKENQIIESNADDPEPRVRRAKNASPAAAVGSERVQVTVFVDYQCPYCRKLHPAVERLRKAWGARATIELRHNPLSFHPLARPAARAALAARLQGKEWEMSHLLFQGPTSLDPKRYAAHAKRLGMDVGRFQKDLSDPKRDQEIRADQLHAKRLGASGTPTTFVGKTKIVGSVPFERLNAEVQRTSRGSL